MRIVLAALFLLAATAGRAQTDYLLVGTYTNTGSKGIYVYRFNTATGEAVLAGSTDGVVNPSFLAVSADKNFVYAVNETNGAKPGGVSAFAFDRDAGTLQLLNTQLSGGDDPCYIAIGTKAPWAVVANYSGGSLSALPIAKDGSLLPAVRTVQHKGSSSNKQRQEKAHVHATAFSPDEKYVLAPDLGTDRLMLYRFDTAAAKPLQPQKPAFAASTPGSGPRHIGFHPNGQWVYLIEELSGTVALYHYSNGRLQLKQHVAAHAKGYKGKIGSADIHVSPDGRFLYASNRGDENNIALFAINAGNGTLQPKGYTAAGGKTPRNFTIHPSGNFLLVANQDSDNIVVFKRNIQTGALQPTGTEIKVPRPVCLQLVSH